MRCQVSQHRDVMSIVFRGLLATLWSIRRHAGKVAFMSVQTSSWVDERQCREESLVVNDRWGLRLIGQRSRI